MGFTQFPSLARSLHSESKNEFISICIVKTGRVVAGLHSVFCSLIPISSCLVPDNMYNLRFIQLLVHCYQYVLC